MPFSWSKYAERATQIYSLGHPAVDPSKVNFDLSSTFSYLSPSLQEAIKSSGSTMFHNMISDPVAEITEPQGVNPLQIARGMSDPVTPFRALKWGNANDPLRQRYVEMQRASANTAFDVLQREKKIRGYAVLTNAEQARRAANDLGYQAYNPLMARGIMYRVSGDLGEDGMAKFSLSPLSGAKFSPAEFEMTQQNAGALLSSFMSVNDPFFRYRSGGKSITIHKKLIYRKYAVNERALRAIRTVLSTPGSFEKALGGEFPDILDVGAHGPLASRARQLFTLSMRGISGNTNLRKMLEFYNFATTNRIAAMHSRGFFGRMTPEQIASFETKYRTATWNMIMRDVIDYTSRPAKWPDDIKPWSHTTEVVNPQVLQEGGLAEAIMRQVEGLTDPGASAIPGGIDVDDTTKISTFLKKAEAMVVDRRGVKSVEEMTGTERVRQALAQMDRQEASLKGSLSAFTTDVKHFTENREAVFERLRFLLESPKNRFSLVSQLREKGVLIDVQYAFQNGSALTGSGPGVIVNIVPKGQQVVHPGMPGIVQWFQPIADARGYLTGADGSRKIGRFTAVTDEVMQNAKFAQGFRTGRGRRLMALLQYGLKGYVDYGEKYDFSAASMAAAKNRVLPSIEGLSKKVYVFSPTEMLMAGVAGRMKQITDFIAGGRYDLAQRRVNLAIGDTMKYEIADNVDSVTTLHEWSYRHTINMPRDLVVNPLDLYALRGSDVRETGFVRAFADKLGGREQAQAVFGRLGGDIEYGERVHGNQIAMISRMAGVTPIGGKPGNLSSPMSYAQFHYGMPGGVPFIRPQQEFSAMMLPNAGSERAMTPYLTTTGYEEQMSSRLVRNMRVAFVTGGLGPNGEELGIDDLMSKIGAYEQQMLASNSAAGDLGLSHLTATKLMADIEKGMVVPQSTGGFSWSDRDVQFISGVPLKKVLGKHNSPHTILRGVIGRLLDEAHPDEFDAISQGLGSVIEGAKFTTVGDRLTMQFPSSFRMPDEALKITAIMSQLEAVINTINDRRKSDQSRRAIELFKSMDFFNASGQKFTVKYLDLLVGVRALKDQMYGSMLNPLQRAMAPFQKIVQSLNRNFNHATLHNIELMRMMVEGRTERASQILAAAVLNKANRGVKRAAIEAGSSLLSMHSGSQQVPLPEGLDPTKTLTLQDIVNLGRTQPMDGLSAAEYNARYGHGYHAIDLPVRATVYGENGGAVLQVKRLLVPTEEPRNYGDGFLPGRLNATIDNLARVSQNLQAAANGSEEYNQALNEYNKTVTDYRRALIDALTGAEATGDGSGKGAMYRGFESFELKGQGIAQVPLMQNLWGERAEVMGGLRPGEAVISRDLALKWGVSAEQMERGYVYADIIRNPNVLFGRMAARVHIDPRLKDSMEIFVHRSVASRLVGDSDGDRVAMMLIGKLGNTSPTQKQLAKLEAEAEAQISYASTQWEHEMAQMPSKIESAVSSLAALPFQDLSSLKDIHMQHRIQNAQGVMGALMDPIQVGFMNAAADRSLSEGERMAALISGNVAGHFRELMLKVSKSANYTSDGELFSPWKVDQMLRQSETYGRMKMNGVIFPGEEAKKVEGDLVNYFNDFIVQGLKDKGDPLAESYALFADMTKSMLESGVEMRSQSAITKGIRRAARERDLFPALVALHKGVFGGDFSEFNTNSPADLVLKQLLKRPTAQATDLSELPQPTLDTGRWTRQVNQPPEVTERLQDVAAQISENASQKAAENQRLRLSSQATVTGVVHGGAVAPSIESGEEVVQKVLSSKPAFRNPWVVAGMAAGALTLGTIMMSSNRDTRPESMPQPDMAPSTDNTYGGRANMPMGGKTRIMMDGPGGSAQSFKLKVRANDPRRRQLSEYGYLTSTGAGGGDLSVNVNDNRRDIDQYQQQSFNNALNGR